MFALGTGCIIAAIIIVVAWMYAVSRKGPEPIRQLSYDRTDDRPRPTFSPQRFREAVTELVEPAQPTKRSFELPGVRKFTGEGLLRNVPTLDPEKEGAWKMDHDVVAVFGIHGKLPTKWLDALFVELDGGYALMTSGTKTALLQQIELSSSQLAYLEEQRREAADPEVSKGVSEQQKREVPDFMGSMWEIMAACNPNVSTATCEFRGSAEPKTYPSSMYTGDQQKYADIQMKEIVPDRPGRVLVAMYMGDDWRLWCGKRMDPTEAASIQPLE